VKRSRKKFASTVKQPRLKTNGVSAGQASFYSPAKKADFEKAAEALENILKTDPFNETAFSDLINIYRRFFKPRTNAYEMAVQSFDRKKFYQKRLLLFRNNKL
jgi:hypothetical protein